MSQYFYFYLVNAATPVKGGKLFKEGNCSKKCSKTKQAGQFHLT